MRIWIISICIKKYQHYFWSPLLLPSAKRRDCPYSVACKLPLTADVAPNFAKQNQVLIYVRPGCPNTHTYITNCNSIKVKYLLHRISHHKVNTKFARRQYYYNHSGITSPTATGTPTGERLPSSPGHPLETLHIHYLLPIRDFHWM